MLARASENEDLRDIFEDRFTVSDKIQFIQAQLAERTRLVFEELFVAGASRTEIVVTFLAVLELIRLKQIGVAQEGPFGAIELIRMDADDQESSARMERIALEAEFGPAILAIVAGTSFPKKILQQPERLVSQARRA